MLKSLLVSFSDELIKLANSGSLVDSHHKAVKKDWTKFERNLRSPKFQAAVMEHPGSDDKLKRYTKALGEYKRSTDTLAKIPSRSGGRLHKVKNLPNGTLGCSCADWKYRRSHAGEDCAHIREARSAINSVRK